MDFILCQRGHTLRPLTTVTKAKYKRECPPSDSVPFTTKHRTPNEHSFLPSQPNCSTPWERNPKVIPVYLLSSLRTIIRQLSLFAHFLFAHFLFAHFLFAHFLFAHYLSAHVLLAHFLYERYCLWTSTSITGTRFTEILTSGRSVRGFEFPQSKSVLNIVTLIKQPRPSL